MIAKFDHNAEDVPSSIGVVHSETLIETVYDWIQEYETPSKVFEIILNHETLNDNEKLFCVMSVGQIMSLAGMFNRIRERK